MRRKRKTHPLIGKIGWCDGRTLGLSKGHYVFVRRVYGKKCSVNTFTSLKTKGGKYKTNKFRDVESGIYYGNLSWDAVAF